MKFFALITFSILIAFSFAIKVQHTTAKDPFAEQADSKIALPWGITSTKVHVKEETVLLISLYGNVRDGKYWRLKNEEEIKTTWGIEPMNMDENKSAPYISMDNISGSRKFKQKETWKFLFKMGKVPANGEPAIIKLAYSTTFEAEPEQHMDVHIVVHTKEE